MKILFKNDCSNDLNVCFSLNELYSLSFGLDILLSRFPFLSATSIYDIKKFLDSFLKELNDNDKK